MPRKINKVATTGKAALPQISAQLLEELIPGPVTKEQFEDIFQNFKKAFIERALNAEMSHHLGYGAGQAKPEGTTNHRNGSSAKTVITDTGSLRIDVPREREGVSVRPSHLDVTLSVSQDRVHVNNRAHNAQRLRDFNTFRPTHPPDLYAAIQSRTGGRVPASWGLHRGIGGAAWNECQCSAPLAQGTPAQWMPSTG